MIQVKLVLGVSVLFFFAALEMARAKDFSGYDIFIVAGQSNAVGAGLGDLQDPLARAEVDEQIDQLGRYEEYHLKVIPMGNQLEHWVCDRGGCAVGFAASFARNYVQAALAPGRRVLLVPAALGGSGSFQWDEVVEKISRPDFQDSPLLRDDLIARIRHLRTLPGRNFIRGLLWHQGETDALCLDSKAWCAPLTGGVKGFSG